MNPRQIWTLVIGVAAASGGIGYLTGVTMVKDKLQKEYEASSASMRRAFEAARIDAETPVQTEDELIVLVNRDPDGTAITAEEAVTAVYASAAVSDATNPYHQAVTSSVYASYAELDEEDFFEEDGRVKDQLTMIYDDGVPRFFSGNEEIDDWAERLGGSVVDDMRDAVEKGTPVLYIRNNTTDVDYEVIFQQP